MRVAPQTLLPPVRAGLLWERLSAAVKMEGGHCPPKRLREERLQGASRAGWGPAAVAFSDVH
jgi:hypothetical protein